MIVKRVVRKLLKIVVKISNQLIKKKECYICNTKFYSFTKWQGGTKKLQDYNKFLQIRGSDIDNFGCMYCGSHDRERHIFMYFDKLGIWDKMKNASILHFAPEKKVNEKISSIGTKSYIKADLFPASDDVQKIDATNIPLENGSVDFIIANHILEHIPDYKKALAEFFRVLKPGGMLVCQTPFSKLLRKNFEDDGINTDQLRLVYYGQEDHVRVFSEKVLLESIQSSGFEMNIIEHSKYFTESDAFYYGVNKNEYLILVSKSSLSNQ